MFLDFGATAEVSTGMRKGMVSFLQGAMTRDTARIVAAMKEMGFISRRADPEVFDRVVEYFHDRFRSQLRVDGFSLKDIRFETDTKLASLLDLRELNVSLADLRDAFHVPKEWVLLERTLLLLLGVCTTLDPEMNPIGAIQPYVERFMLGEKKELVARRSSRPRARRRSRRWPCRPSSAVSSAQSTRGDLEVRVGGLDDGRAGALHRVPAAAVGRRWGRRPRPWRWCSTAAGRRPGGCWRCWPRLPVRAAAAGIAVRGRRFVRKRR